MAFVKRSGEQAEVEGRIKLDAEGEERLLDMLIVALSQAGHGQNAIAYILGRSQGGICRRLAMIPPNVRAYLETQAAAMFGGSLKKEQPAVIVLDSDHSQAVQRSRADIDDSDEAVERLVDVLALSLSQMGLKPRHVGYVVGLSESEAKRRIEEIPDEIRSQLVAMAAELL